MKKTRTKEHLYEQVARIGKAVSSPKRLEIIDLLAQGEKSVEALCSELAMDIKLASAHLKALREARLVTSRQQGKYRIYRLAGSDVAALWVTLRQVAEKHLSELQIALQKMVSAPENLVATSREILLERASRGEVIVIDVRPQDEFLSAHLPFACSMPLNEISRRLAELPEHCEIVAYCRGPFCLLSDEAVSLLRAHGFHASKISDGVSEWRAAGLPVEAEGLSP
jgi:DNA-binding transcriptional ArsR family regulator